MKKLLMFVVLLLFASSFLPAYAIPLFITAQEIGIGKSEVTGYYGTSHDAGGFGCEASTYTDRQDFNFRYLYGLADRTDIIFGYSFDSYPNFTQYGIDLETPGVDVATKVVSGNSYNLGIKYTYLKATEGYPLDVAFMLAYENRSATFNIKSVALATSKDWTTGVAGWLVNCVFSKKTQSITPYLSLGYGQVNSFEYTHYLGGKVPSVAETAIFLNLGVEYELPHNLSAVLEYQSENEWWEKTSSSAWYVNPGEDVGCGYYLALKYKF